MKNITLIIVSLAIGEVIYPVLGLYNFSCACVQYYGNYGILCYAVPCLQIYNVTTHTYSTQYVTLSNNIFPQLLANDGELQQQIQRLNQTVSLQILNAGSNNSPGSISTNWIQLYYRDLLIGILFVLLVLQTIYFNYKISRICETIKPATVNDQPKQIQQIQRKRRRRQMTLQDIQSTCEISNALENFQIIFVENTNTKQ